MSIERCVKELGFIGCKLNPDPSGGWWTDPPLTGRYWYPIYEMIVELDVPATSIQLKSLSEENRSRLVEGNARKVFGRLDAALKERGLR